MYRLGVSQKKFLKTLIRDARKQTQFTAIPFRNSVNTGKCSLFRFNIPWILNVSPSFPGVGSGPAAGAAPAAGGAAPAAAEEKKEEKKEEPAEESDDDMGFGLFD